MRDSKRDKKLSGVEEKSEATRSSPAAYVGYGMERQSMQQRIMKREVEY
jgi:hypothetical protein